MKKIIAFFLALVLTIGAIPTAFASDYTCSTYEDCTQNGNQIYVVTRDCPIRTEPHNAGPIYARAEPGQLLSVKRLFWTLKMTRWVELETDAGALYIHIDNCEPHRHSYTTIFSNNNGFIEFCADCGIAKATAEGKTATCDFTCALDQSVKGSFSDYNPSFAGILGQIVAGEVLGPIADGRDLVGDIMSGQPAWIIGMDLVGFLPVIGALRFADEIVVFGKNSDVVKYLDEILDGGKYLDEITSVVSKTNSTTLGKNMREAYKLTGKDRFYDLSDYIYDGSGNVAAHHIVAGGANNAYAKKSRAILAFVGIDVNDAENGVWLISNAKYSDDAVLHSGRHSSQYFEDVYSRLYSAVKDVDIPIGASDSAIISTYREAVIEALDDIAESLMTGDGRFKLN